MRPNAPSAFSSRSNFFRSHLWSSLVRLRQIGSNWCANTARFAARIDSGGAVVALDGLNSPAQDDGSGGASFVELGPLSPTDNAAA